MASDEDQRRRRRIARSSPLVSPQHHTLLVNEHDAAGLKRQPNVLNLFLGHDTARPLEIDDGR